MNQPLLPPLTVIGSINLDLIASTDRLPAAGETVGRGLLHRQAGGKGANQATAAARLGGGVRLIGSIGNDEAGRQLLGTLAASGVNVADILLSSQPTGTALIVVDRFGENQIVVCPGANSQLSLEGISFADDESVLCQLENGVDVVLEASRQHRGYFALNAAPAESLPDELVTRCDLVIVNETEFALLPELSNARLVAVTYGERGSAIYEYGTLVARAAALPTRVVNTVGAGDAFCSALVLALRTGHDYHRALAAANAVGSDAVRDASSQPRLSSLEHYLETTRTTPGNRR
ncbi:ribokinase [Arthrobacter sp. UYEF3]|uniref:ribokinase n=1 Tax=Arthrobacter sp. UYEF3 TaxID=1756365 RepID=UPI003392476E